MTGIHDEHNTITSFRYGDCYWVGSLANVGHPFSELWGPLVLGEARA